MYDRISQHIVNRLFLLGVFSGVSSCLQGPTPMQQSSERSPSREAAEEVLIVAVSELEGVVTGALSASLNQTQLVYASNNSAISGSHVSFPPGSIALDTTIVLGEGQSLVTTNILQELDIEDNPVAKSSVPVSITSSILLDASVPFTIALPMPDSANLWMYSILEPYANLAVMYRVNKASSQDSSSGIIPRNQIKIENGYAVISTSHFGVFQTVIMTKPITVAVEVPTIKPEEKPIAEEKPPAKNLAKFYYGRGFLSSSFGNDSSKDNGFQAWVHTATPARVGNGTTMTIDYVTGIKEN